MENYICINGKKTELTKEQMKALGIELCDYKAPFKRVPGQRYYFTHGDGVVYSAVEKDSDLSDSVFFSVANYCTDKELMEQWVLRETLNRLLWRFSEMNGGQGFYALSIADHEHINIMSRSFICLDPSFKTAGIAKRAIDEVVKPFLAAHPDFACQA